MQENAKQKLVLALAVIAVAAGMLVAVLVASGCYEQDEASEDAAALCEQAGGVSDFDFDEGEEEGTVVCKDGEVHKLPDDVEETESEENAEGVG